MKKRMGLFLIAVALATTALSSKPMAARPLCGPNLACLIGPVCCTNEACAGFCRNLSPGSIPHCSGTYPEGGCCDCQPAEAGI
jgi:hypothetical protein